MNPLNNFDYRPFTTLTSEFYNSSSRVLKISRALFIYSNFFSVFYTFNFGNKSCCSTVPKLNLWTFFLILIFNIYLGWTKTYKNGKHGCGYFHLTFTMNVSPLCFTVLMSHISQPGLGHLLSLEHQDPLFNIFVYLLLRFLFSWGKHCLIFNVFFYLSDLGSLLTLELKVSTGTTLYGCVLSHARIYLNF